MIQNIGKLKPVASKSNKMIQRENIDILGLKALWAAIHFATL